MNKLTNVNQSKETKTENTRTGKGQKRKKRRVILLSILGVFLILITVAGIFIYQALGQPESLFHTAGGDPPSTPKPMIEDIDDPGASAPSGTVQPEATPELFADQHIINVLLLGLDQDDKSYAEDGGDYHTDAIIVLAINFDKNTIDMISLPRDTFTHVPGIRGIYKLNAAINCGGGKTDDGFRKVCEAASWLLGGIQIDYYYAFELDTVIEIGDLIDGVDFDVDMAYTGSSGITYKKGAQHLDGTGIYDYMRARTNATGEPGDKGRMNRCKAMLKAIISKVKEEIPITQIPALIGKVNEGLYQNTTLQQTMALAYFAYDKVDIDSMGSYTLKGKNHYALDWGFCFIDQEARVELIKEVYGVDVPELDYVSYEYANWLDDYGFKTIRYLVTAHELADYIEAKGIDTLNEEQREIYSSLKEAYRQTQAAFNTAASTLDRNDNDAMKYARNVLRDCTEKLAEAIGYPNQLSWSVKSAWYEDPCINEVNVNFR